MSGSILSWIVLPLKCMKKAASILMIIWAITLVQPAFALFGGKSGYGTCSKIETAKPACTKTKAAGSLCTKKKPNNPVCSKSKCNKPANSDDKDNCNSNDCNPSLGCSAGNFYVHHHAGLSLISWFIPRQMIIVTDDNRIAKNLSECFHPPEA
jgi:hypothetical protein